MNWIKNSREHTAFLSASSVRTRLLLYLQEHSGCPSEIATDLSASRRGIQRNLTKLTEKGWAVKTDGEYQLTDVGGLIAQRYAAFLDSLNVLIEVEPLFQYLPNYLSLPNPQWFHNDMVITDENTPYAPAAQYTRWLREISTESLRGVLPVSNHFSNNILSELLAKPDMHIKIVACPSIIETLGITNKLGENISRSDSVTLYEHREEARIGICLSDDYAFLSVYDNHNHLRACVKCDHPGFREWSERIYEHARESAQPVPLSV